MPLVTRGLKVTVIMREYEKGRGKHKAETLECVYAARRRQSNKHDINTHTSIKAWAKGRGTAGAVKEYRSQRSSSTSPSKYGASDSMLV